MFKFIITILCLTAALALPARQTDDTIIVVNGTVRDSDNKKVLENVSISIPGTNIGTVSNSDGTFSLKVPKTNMNGGIRAEQFGYQSSLLPIDKLIEGNHGIIIYLKSSAKMLKEVIVRGGKPEEIVAEALKKIPVNYPANKSLYSAFYRETVQKGKRYIGVSEAMVDVYKTPYKHRVSNGERVQIKKGEGLSARTAGTRFL